MLKGQKQEVELDKEASEQSRQKRIRSISSGQFGVLCPYASPCAVLYSTDPKHRLTSLSTVDSPTPAMSLCGWTYASFKSRVILCFHPPTRALLRSSRRRSCTAAPVGRAIHTLSGHIQKPNSDHEHFFRYTSGRWLWDEDQQLRDRYKAFNVAELQAAAAQAAGSSACIAMTKLAEGGYNKVFRLLMDDGKVVLARIPNPNAGPPFYTTASEVATMEFVSWPGHEWTGKWLMRV